VSYGISIKHLAFGTMTFDLLTFTLDFDLLKNFSQGYIFMPPRSKIGGHIVFVLSVILSETLTLPITFEW
jgi:hypothetical protein